MDALGDCPQFVSKVNSAVQNLLTAKTISNEDLDNSAASDIKWNQQDCSHRKYARTVSDDRYFRLLDSSIAVFKTFSESEHVNPDSVVVWEGRRLVGWAAVRRQLLDLLVPFLKPDRDVRKDVDNLKSRWNHRCRMLDGDEKRITNNSKRDEQRKLQKTNAAENAELQRQLKVRKINDHATDDRRKFVRLEVEEMDEDVWFVEHRDAEQKRARASVELYDNSREEHVRKMWRQLSTDRGSGRVLEKNDAALDELLKNIPDTCPLLENKLVWTRAEREGMSYDPYSPSIDRIHNHLGYVPGNVWIVSRRANSIKSDANVAELQMLTRNLQAKIAHD